MLDRLAYLSVVGRCDVAVHAPEHGLQGLFVYNTHPIFIVQVGDLIRGNVGGDIRLTRGYHLHAGRPEAIAGRIDARPRARIVATAVTSFEPTIMLTGPAPASCKARARAGLDVSDIDLFEINEAFASVALRFMNDLEIGPDKVNVNGGAIAMGQSPQDFSRWGVALGKALGVDLELVHEPACPRTRDLRLISRRDYGQDMQAPSAILRFALPRTGLLARLMGRGWKRFEAGDLLGVLPQGPDIARFYSLASGTRDGFVEICVKKHACGVCSGQLMELQIGDSITAFIRPNLDFRPAAHKKPVILIGAGTGIGPLAGFARANTRQRPMHLYFGIRHETSDLFYDEELREWQRDGHLHSVEIARSRTQEQAYLQDILRRNVAKVTALIEEGAQVLVGGGRDMATGVIQALQEVLSPRGLCPIRLKAEGRYVEEVY